MYQFTGCEWLNQTKDGKLHVVHEHNNNGKKATSYMLPIGNRLIVLTLVLDVIYLFSIYDDAIIKFE